MEQRGYDRNVGQPLHGYVILHLLPVGLLMSWMLTFDQTLPTEVLALGSLTILWTAFGWLGLFERRAWAFGSEVARHLAGAAAMIFLGTSALGLPGLTVGLGLTAASLAWLVRQRSAIRAL